MPLRTFRYAACGGFNTFFGLSVYFFFLYFVFHNQNVDLGFYVLKPHNAALVISSSASFAMGFLLNKYVVFTESNLQGRVQLVRYALTFAINIVVNYFLLKIFVEHLQWNPFWSQVLTTFFVVAIGYLLQRYFTFR